MAMLAAATGLSCLVGLRPAEAGSYGMGPGMMGPGMMGPGMMGPPGANQETSPAQVNPSRAEALLSYIHEQDPVCLQCHVVAGTSFGPSFASIAANYANRADAEQRLTQHIAQGFGRMPPGLASAAQAARLAKLILELPEPESPSQAGQTRR
ncbi:MAG: c-type cytochrome [Hyphomicrobiaceae bacterium]